MWKTWPRISAAAERLLSDDWLSNGMILGKALTNAAQIGS
jgi:hypothetical protein